MEAIQTATAEDLKFYEQAAIEYYRSLPLEHFMESPLQAFQRKITLESFDIVHLSRPDVWCHNELCVQHPAGGDLRNIRRVVPDNILLIHKTPMNGDFAYNDPFEDSEKFMALEYVSRSDPDKDYVLNLSRLAEAGFRYYLTVDWELEEGHEAIVRRLDESGRYLELSPNKVGRVEIPELDLELGMHDGWLRYWYCGELIPLPADLVKNVKPPKLERRQRRRA